MKTNQKKLIAEIVPTIKLPRNVTQIFSYVISDKFKKKIKVGMLVEISFGGKNILGIVFSIKKEKLQKRKYKLKNITNLLDFLNLSKEQIELAKYISDYYYIPISIIIKTIIPAITKKKARKKIEFNYNCKIIEKKTNLNKLLKKIKEKKRFLLIHDLQSERHSLYLNLAKNILKENEQALILFPETFDIYNFTEFYIDKLGQDKIAVLTSELTKNQYFDEWKKIKSGKVKIIIGTRQAVFGPFQNLKLIIADDEHNSNYKQWDQNPRYHGITVAKKLAKIWNAKIILSSPAPSIENYYNEKNKLYITHYNYKISEMKSLYRNFFTFYNDKSSKDTNVRIINAEEERKNGNYSALSEKLQNDLIKNIYQKKKAIIFVPRLGINTITKCNDCNFIAECKECKNILISYKNYLYCTNCGKKTTLLKKCPKCQGQNIKSFGYGSENIEKEIKKLFENKNIKIQRLDSTVISEKNNQTKIYKDFINKKIDILVGTQMVLKNWNMENLSILALISPEIIFNQPDFRSKEKSFQFLNSILQIASKKTQVIIQTNNIRNSIYKLLKNENRDNFYKQEIQDRKIATKIGYPPFSQLIKLVFKDQNLEKCKSEANLMYKIMKEKISSDKKFEINFEITKPFPASNFREYGKYRYNIIIKSICKNIKLRNSLLDHIKKDWIIDVDPDRIL